MSASAVLSRSALATPCPEPLPAPHRGTWSPEQHASLLAKATPMPAWFSPFQLDGPLTGVRSMGYQVSRLGVKPTGWFCGLGIEAVDSDRPVPALHVEAVHGTRGFQDIRCAGPTVVALQTAGRPIGYLDDGRPAAILDMADVGLLVEQLSCRPASRTLASQLTAWSRAMRLVSR